MAGRRRRRGFSEGFEREAVERVRASGMLVIAVADGLGLHETVLRRLQKHGEPGMGLARRPRRRSRRRSSTAASSGSSPADLAAGNARPGTRGSGASSTAPAWSATP